MRKEQMELETNREKLFNQGEKNDKDNMTRKKQKLRKIAFDL